MIKYTHVILSVHRCYHFTGETFTAPSAHSNKFAASEDFYFTFNGLFLNFSRVRVEQFSNQSVKHMTYNFKKDVIRLPIKWMATKWSRLFDNNGTFLLVSFSSSICVDDMQYLWMWAEDFRVLWTIATKVLSVFSNIHFWKINTCTHTKMTALN